jgi:Flp pilus assembly protein TadG
MDSYMEKLKNRNRGGFILLTHGVMLFFLHAAVGLAVDAGTMYVIKGRLSSAVDAAALAAGRSLNLADTVNQAQTDASATATQFFKANFPGGFLGVSSVTLSTPVFTQQTDGNGNPTGLLTIAVNATAVAPTYFMQIFGIKSVSVTAFQVSQQQGLYQVTADPTQLSVLFQKLASQALRLSP